MVPCVRNTCLPLFLMQTGSSLQLPSQLGLLLKLQGHLNWRLVCPRQGFSFCRAWVGAHLIQHNFYAWRRCWCIHTSHGDPV